MAFVAIASHKLRSALTLLGVLVGVFSILGVMTAMRVLQRDVEGQLSALGTHTFMVTKAPLLMLGDHADFQRYWRRQNLTYESGLKLMERATLPRAIGIETTFWSGEVETRYNASAPTVTMYGETPGSFAARNWVIAEGRMLSEADVENRRDVAVLGAALARAGFPHGSALGEQIKINGINYTVIGVLEAKGSALREDQDNLAIVPVTTGLERTSRRWQSVNLLVQAADQASYGDTVDEVRGILRVLRKVPPGEEDDFEIASNDSLIREFNNFTRAVRLGVAAVSSIALLAAGIGIMNIMLVSVTERTREIGVRRAVGAKKRHIRTQFILEAVVLCQLGGVAGALLGLAAGNGLAYLMKVPPAVPLDWLVLGLLICSVVGVIFGTYPAWRAANLDPVDSLRYE
jgi:putative ABC transport system permease protein